MCLTFFTLIVILIFTPLVVQPEELILQPHNDYYYKFLSTPDYPNKFSTPHIRQYFINTENLKEFRKPRINVYLTELHIYSQYIKFFSWNHDRTILGPPIAIGLDTRVISTFSKTLEIQINITDLYDNHFRSPEHFIHTFGFNISIEIVEESVGYSEGCSIQKCFFAGICRSTPGSTRLEFRCDCMPDYEGLYCEHGPKCDSRKNISSCSNGGKCSVYGLTGTGNCVCPEGFSGNKCQLKPLGINFVSEAKDCLSTNVQGNDRPCSLCHKDNPPKDWHRFLLVQNKDYNQTLSKAFSENYYIRSNTTTKSGNVLEIFGLTLNTTLQPSKGSLIKQSNYENYSRSTFTMKPQIIVNKKLPLNKGRDFSLTCKCQVPLESKYLIAFKWFKDNVLIQPSYTNRFYKQIESIHSNGTEMWSVLMTDNTTSFDIGVFTCQATDLVRNVQECKDIHIDVLIPPFIEVEPMSATIMKNGSVVLTCTYSPESINNDTKAELNWYKDGELITLNKDKSFILEKTYFQGILLRVLNAQHSMLLECRASNRAGWTSHSIQVDVLENPYYSCSGTWEDQIDFRKSWDLTGIGQTAMEKCPKGFSGYQQKTCLNQGNDLKSLGAWAPTDFSRCTHAQLFQLNFTLQSMKNGFNVKKEGLSIFPIRLNGYLNSRRKNRTTLLLGEGDKFISMITDTLDYFNQLRTSNHVIQEDIEGMVAVVDKFISFGYSCVHETSVLELAETLIRFILIQEVENFDDENIFIQTFSLENSSNDSNSSYFESNTTNARIGFEYFPNENDVETRMFFIKLSNFKGLNKDERLISDIISVNTNKGKFHFKDNTTYEIEFVKNTTHMNLTCAGLHNRDWKINNSCTIEVTQFTIKCTCRQLGIFAVLAVKNEPEPQPISDELKSPLPDWIATSGCIVCLVLCFRTLTTTVLINKNYCPYFITTTIGIIASIFCLLHLIIIWESKAVEFLYLSTTLFIKSLRIWRMICLYDMHDTCPWLIRVSKWILLAAITMSLILPLSTVFVFDIIYTDSESILGQFSPVFITFGILITLAFLTIVFVYYKTYLRIKRKGNFNNNNNGNQNALTENMFNAMFHLAQMLAFFLYFNMKYCIWCHISFSILTGVLGLSWRSPRSFRPKSQQSIKHDEGGSRTVSTTAMSITAPTSFINTPNNPMELKSFVPRGRKYRTSFDDCDQNDHEAVHASVSTITNNGNKIPASYLGMKLVRVASYIYDDYDYVQPSKLESTK